MSRSNKSQKKIAIVHDDFIQNGGAEKLVECLLEIYPSADLYTSIISNAWRTKLKIQNPNLKIVTSFLDNFPYKRKLYKVFSFLYPIAFWLFDFNGYDYIISSSARFAHGIKTPSGTYHVAYVNSPGRMIWEPSKYFNLPTLIFVYPLILILRQWDKYVSAMPDHIIANSKTVQSRIKKYWKRNSEVIYPFHNLNVRGGRTSLPRDYFIVVSRLEKWKRIDLPIKVCNELKQPLVIVGDGAYKSELEKISDPLYVKFMGRLSEQDLIKTYLGSKALIMPQQEDFGITSIEAQSLEVPVIAYASGGALETIINNKTGLFFNEQTIKSLKNAIINFGEIEIKPQECIIQANKFTKQEFIRRMTSLFQ